MSKEWAFCGIAELQAALAAGEITSRGLVEYFRDRIEKLNPALNAVVATNYDDALKRADEADAAQAEGDVWGPLHGIPMTIKDTFEVIGMPCTAGSRSLAQHMPKSNAFTVQRLIDAGAVVIGKTNVPLYAGDLQTFNKVYGTSNNPHDVSLTPGGSSGGAASALAAGLTPIELGSDLAGSIRTPSNFCGTYGHKPTHGLLSCRGHIPGPPGMLMEPDLATPGPMARTASDLNLMMDILTVPGPSMGEHWDINLPDAPDKDLQDYKVLLWTEDPLAPIDSEVKAVYDQVLEHLKQKGVNVTVGAPEGMSLETFLPTYLNLLGSVLSGNLKPALRPITSLMGKFANKLVKPLKLSPYIGNVLQGMSQAHAEFLKQHETRLRIARKADRIFDQYDVVLTPVVPVTAFKHQQKPALHMRKLEINGEERPYTEIFNWIAPATLMGLPATSAPVGSTKNGLPVNVQILGRKYHDKTTIKFASLLEKSLRGFIKPEGY